MKRNGFGQAEVLSTSELNKLISCMPSPWSRTLAEVLRRTGSRVAEGSALTWSCIGPRSVLFPATVVKGKLKTREVPASQQLQRILLAWRTEWAASNGREPGGDDYLFPGRSMKRPATTRAFQKALERAASEARLVGVSSHSFRRSALTAASAAGIPLRDLMELSGHSSLSSLQRYLEVDEAAKVRAAEAFA